MPRLGWESTLLWVVPLVAVAEAKVFELGLYGPITSVSQDYLAAVVAFDLDFRKNFESDIRAAYGPPIISVPHLDPDLRVNVQIGTDLSMASAFVMDLMNAFKGLGNRSAISGLVGGYHFAETKQMADMSSMFKVPQISPASTDLMFSDKSAYPFFMRTIQPNSVQAAAIWAFIETFSVPLVTCLYATEPYSEKLLQSVSSLAAVSLESFLIDQVGIPFMPGTYDFEFARAKIRVALSGSARVFLLLFTFDQGRQFFTAAEAEGMLVTKYQLIGADSLPSAVYQGRIPHGYLFFRQTNRGPKFANFAILWQALTVDIFKGAAAVAAYTLDGMKIPLSKAYSTALSASTFENVSDPEFEIPFYFDAAYLFVLAVNALLNEGHAISNIKGRLLLDKLKSIEFEGVSGYVKFDSNGDRLGSMLVVNVQRGREVNVAVFNASTGLVTIEPGQNISWMEGSTNNTAIPQSVIACQAGWMKTAQLICRKCAKGLVSNAVGDGCVPCPSGMVVVEGVNGDRCEYFAIQIGILGPITSVTSDHLAAAVAFELDLRKNFDQSLVERFGPPVVRVPGLRPELRIKVQIGTSDSNPEFGVATALDLFQGANGRDPIVCLVGEYHSSISMPIASLATQYKVTQVSFASTNPRLSNKGEYPYFLRTIPPDSLSGEGMWRLIKFFSIPSVTFVYSLESYGEGLFQVVSNAASSGDDAFRVQAVGIVYMPTAYVSEEALAVVHQVLRMSSKIVFVVMNLDQGKGFFPVAKAGGLLSKGYQVFGSMDLPLNDLAEWLIPGYMWISPTNRGNLFSNFTEFWKKMKAADVLDPQATVLYGLDKFKVPISKGRVAPVSDGTFLGTDSIDLFAPYLFDAGYAFVFAANTLLDRGTAASDIRGKLLLDAVKEVNFEGISGKVKFNKFGDRLGDYMIMNVQVTPSDGGRRLVALHGVIVAFYSAASGSVILETDQVVRWMSGDAGSMVPQSLTVCTAGFRLSESGICTMCSPGEISSGGAVTTCSKCPKGFAANAPLGATECLPCELGSFAADVGAVSCLPCQLGFFAPSEAAFTCEACPVGTFSHTSTDGTAASCQPCTPPLTTARPAAATAVACVCPVGMYASSEAHRQCAECPDAMSCGSVNTTFAALVSSSCSTDTPCPQVDPGYMTLEEKPTKPFKCRETSWCPGGPTASCALNRDPQSVGCSTCLAGTYAGSDGQCYQCVRAVWIPIVAGVLILLLSALAVFSLFVDRLPLAQLHSSRTAVTIAAIFCTAFQTLGLFSSIPVSWMFPLGSLVQAWSLINFDLDMLQPECWVGSDDAARYGGRQLVAPIAAAVVVAALFLKRRLNGSVLPARVVLLNSVGKTFQLLIVSMTLSILQPFICYGHPGTNGYSVTNHPSVICFEGGQHTSMIIMAVLSFLLIVLPHCAAVVWATTQYRSSVSRESAQAFLATFRYLFYLYEPKTYYYSTVIIARSLLLCLVPVVARDSPFFMIAMMISLILGFGSLQLYLSPWRSPVSNILDHVFSNMSATVLICSLPLVDISSSSLAVGIFGTVVFGVACFCGLCSLARAMYLRMFSREFFRWFICHSKADAAAQSRFLQLLLRTRAGKECFLDCDHLTNLDGLIDIVRCQVCQFLVYATANTLKRPWCAAEITVTFLTKRSLTCIRTPSCYIPSADDLARDGIEHVLDIAGTNLAEYGITGVEITDAYSWLASGGQGCQYLDLLLETVGCVRFYRLAGAIIDEGVTSATATPIIGRAASVVISCVQNDAEAMSTAGILLLFIQAAVLEFCHAGVTLLADETHTTDEAVLLRLADAHAVICILTSGTLHDKQQLDIMAFLAGEPLSGLTDRQARSVLVSALSFTFMSESTLLQSLLDGGFSTECALRYSVSASKLFKHIAVSLNVHAAESVLKAQAFQAVARLPRQTRSKSSRRMQTEAIADPTAAPVPVQSLPAVEQDEAEQSLRTSYSA